MWTMVIMPSWCTLYFTCLMKGTINFGSMNREQYSPLAFSNLGDSTVWPYKPLIREEGKSIFNFHVGLPNLNLSCFEFKSKSPYCGRIRWARWTDRSTIVFKASIRGTSEWRNGYWLRNFVTRKSSSHFLVNSYFVHQQEAWFFQKMSYLMTFLIFPNKSTYISKAIDWV